MSAFDWDYDRRTGRQLTPRERETIVAYAELGDQRAVGDRLGVSVQTVKNHLSTVYAKLDVHSSLEALTVLGWIHVPGVDEDAGVARARMRELDAELAEVLEHARTLVGTLEHAVDERDEAAAQADT